MFVAERNRLLPSYADLRVIGRAIQNTSQNKDSDRQRHAQDDGNFGNRIGATMKDLRHVLYKNIKQGKKNLSTYFTT